MHAEHGVKAKELVFQVRGIASRALGINPLSQSNSRLPMLLKFSSRSERFHQTAESLESAILAPLETCLHGQQDSACASYKTKDDRL